MPSVLSRPVMVSIRRLETEKAKQIKLAHFQERLETYGPYWIECHVCGHVFSGESDIAAIGQWETHLTARHQGLLRA